MCDQTREWSDLVVRQVTEEHELMKEHVRQQNELLVKLIEEAHQLQLTELEARQERSVFVDELLTLWKNITFKGK